MKNLLYVITLLDSLKCYTRIRNTLMYIVINIITAVMNWKWIRKI